MSIGNEALIALIRDRLMLDGRTAALAIDVCSCDGFVSLVGSVDTVEQKELAVRLITGLVGVRNVSDELVVRKRTPVASSAGGGWAAA